MIGLCMPAGELAVMINGVWENVSITDAVDDDLLRYVREAWPSAESIRFTDRYGNVEYFEEV